MNKQYDLHAHSTASDGTLTPAGLMQRAARAGVGAMALTDHDTLAGLAEAREAANQAGIGFIPGVEVSVTWEKSTVHIVGLGVDANSQALQNGLAGLREYRIWRAQEIARRLVASGVDERIYDRAKALSNGYLISRTHFARALVGLGQAKSVRDVFKKFLVGGKPGHLAGEWTTLQNAVSWINTAGGQAVIAHPARYRLRRARLQQLIREFIAAGGSAIEVVSGSHSRDDYFTMAQHAREFGLLASAGTDYHGPENPNLELGRLPDLPPGCQPIWHDWAKP